MFQASSEWRFRSFTGFITFICLPPCCKTGSGLRHFPNRETKVHNIRIIPAASPQQNAPQRLNYIPLRGGGDVIITVAALKVYDLRADHGIDGLQTCELGQKVARMATTQPMESNLRKLSLAVEIGGEGGVFRRGS